jgi:hypothetical protein
MLTRNDLGETGGHQAGIAVPKKNKTLLNFFPELDTDEFNPEAWITCIDIDGTEWVMRYVYYNGKTFFPPKSTRNEYRITHMSKFFSKWGAKSGDSVVFKKTNRNLTYEIAIEKQSTDINKSESQSRTKPIVLRGWSNVY